VEAGLPQWSRAAAPRPGAPPPALLTVEPSSSSGTAARRRRPWSSSPRWPLLDSSAGLRRLEK
jgi:hypothetical protein